jgi:hypothetical protein
MRACLCALGLMVGCGGAGAVLGDAGTDGTTSDATSEGGLDATADVGPDSGCPPVQLSTKDAGGPTVCGTSSCSGTTHVCCPSTGACVAQGPIATECDGGLAIECEINGDCPSQPQLCCLGTTTLQTDPTCGTKLAPTFGGTACFGGNTCPTGHVPACEKQSDCKTGTCMAFSALGRSWGGCF